MKFVLQIESGKKDDITLKKEDLVTSIESFQLNQFNLNLSIEIKTSFFDHFEKVNSDKH